MNGGGGLVCHQSLAKVFAILVRAAPTAWVCVLTPQLPAPCCFVWPTRIILWLLARSTEPTDGHVRQLSHRKE
jgi:hypothetical protein